MKANCKKILTMVITLALVLVPFINVRAEELPDPVEVGSEEKLIEELANESTTSIKLTADIKLTKPLYAYREVVIDGDGFTLDGANIVAGAEDGGNKSIITAQPGGELSLINIKLVNAPKYGVQAYNGGAVLLNGVTIEECKYGAVLINGGIVVVQDLTMIKNGSFDNGKTGNGIEIGKGANVTEDPYLVMDGTFTVQEQETVLWIAENDNLVNDENAKIMFGHTEDSEYTLSIEENALVAKNADGEVVAASNAILDEITSDEIVDEPTTPDVELTPDQDPINPPATNDNVLLFAGLAVIALGLGTVTYRKLCK